MMTWMRARLHGEDGMSLVELLVAIFVVGLALMAMASTMVTALASVTANEGHIRANALAAEMLENLKAIDWDLAGHYDDDFAPATPPADTVILGPSRPVSAAACIDEVAPRPVCDVVRDGITYTVRRAVTWVDEPATIEPQDYKRLSVQLAWSARGRSYDVTVDSLRSPTPAEKDSSDYVIRAHDARPGLVYLNDDGTIDLSPSYSDPPVTISLETNQDVVAADVKWRDRYNVERTHNLDLTSSLRTWTELIYSDAGGTPWEFRNGHVEFLFTVTRNVTVGGVTTQETLTTQKLVQFLHAARLDPIQISPSDLCGTTAANRPDLTVTFDVQGYGVDDTMNASWNGGPVVKPDAVATVAGAHYSFTIPGSSYGDTLVIDIDGLRPIDNVPVASSTTVTLPTEANPCSP